MRVSISSASTTLVAILACLSTHAASAWTTPSTATNNNNHHNFGGISRQNVLKTLGTGVVATLLSPSLAVAAAVETLPSGVTYQVVKAGDGPKPEIGELIAIRFAAFAGDNKIDDIFDTPEPYYTRLGSGGLLKGVETTLPLMRVGDRWKLTIPVRASNCNIHCHGVWCDHSGSLARLCTLLLFLGGLGLWKERTPRQCWKTTNSCRCSHYF